MGRRGPPRTPTVIAKKLGIRIQRVLKGKEPVPPAAPLTVGIPAALKGSPHAITCWKDYYPLLVKLRLVTSADVLSFQGLCMAYARAREADESVRKYGIVRMVRAKGFIQNPAVMISQRAWSEVRKYAQEFGLTPASRTRVRELDEQEFGGGKDEQRKQTPEEFIFGATGTHGKVAGRIGPPR